MNEPNNFNEQPQLEQESESIPNEFINTQPSKFEVMLSNVLKEGTPEEVIHVLLHFPAYLNEIGDTNELKNVLTSYLFLREKLASTNIEVLLSDFKIDLDDGDVNKIKKGLEISKHILSRNKDQLIPQLYARLSANQEIKQKFLTANIDSYEKVPWIKPLAPFKSNITNQLRITVEAHTRPISNLQISSDQQSVYSAASDGIRMWDIKSGELVQEFLGHENYILELHENLAHNMLISTSGDGTLKMWDRDTGNVIHSIIAKDKKAFSILKSRNPTFLFVETGKGNVQKLNISTFEVEKTYSIHEGGINHFIELQHTTEIVSLSDDNILKIWNTVSGEIEFSIIIKAPYARSALINQNETRLVVRTDQQVVQIWDLENKELIVDIDGHKDRVLPPFFMNDHKYVITSSRDREINIWDVENGHVVKTLPSSSDSSPWLTSIVPSANEEYIILGFRDGSIKMWNIESNTIQDAFGSHIGEITFMKLNHSKQKLITVSKLGSFTKQDNTIKIWDLASQKLLHILSDHLHKISYVTESKDGKTIVSATSADGQIRIWDVGNSNDVEPFVGHVQRIVQSTSIQNKMIITSSQDNYLKMWSVETCTFIKNIESSSFHIVDILETKDKKYFVTVAYDQTIKIWSSLDGNLLYTLRDELNEFATGANFLHEITNNRIALGGSYNDPSIKIIDYTKGEIVLYLKGHTKVSNVFIESQDNRSYITASDDFTIKIWDKETGLVVHNLAKHNNSINALLESQHNAFLISGDEDGTVIIWDRNTGKPLSILEQELNAVKDLYEVSSGNYILVESGTGFISFWDVNLSSFIRYDAHASYIPVNLLSKDKKYLITGGSEHDPTVKVWDVESKKLINSFAEHTDTISHIVESANGQYIVSSSFDGTLKIWKNFSNKSIATIEVDARISNFMIYPKLNRLIVFGMNGEVLFFQIENLDINLPELIEM